MTTKPHDRAIANATAQLVTEEVAQLHDQIAQLRQERAMLADEIEASNNRLRKRIIDPALMLDALKDVNKALSACNEDMALTIHIHEKANAELAATVYERTTRIESQRAEIAELKFEVLRLRELAEQWRLDKVALQGHK